MSAPYLRPMAVGEIIANALRLYRDHFRLLVMVALFPHLALLAVESLVMLQGPPSSAAFLLVMGVTVVMNGIALAAITVAIGRCVLGEEPTLVEIYRQAFSRTLPAVVVAYVVTALLVSVGLMFLVAPGVLVGALFAPLVPIIVVERRSTAQGLSRSVQLMREQLLKGIVVFTYFVAVAGFLPLLLLLAQGSAAMGPLSPLLSAIVGAVTLPLGFTANVMLYFSLRATDAEATAALEAELKANAAAEAR